MLAVVAALGGAFAGALAVVLRRVADDREHEKRLCENLERAVAERTRILREELDRTSALAAVGQLVAGVGHEINNPLAYVLTNLDVIAEETAATNAELAASLQEAKDGVERIRQIVRDLQALSRVDEGDRPVSLRSVIERAVRMASAQMRHAARVRVEVGTLPEVYASETRLGQVLINLFLNAAQAIGDGGAELNEIRIRAFTDAAGRANVEVSDTGPGIPPEIRPKLFEPVFTTKPVGRGTGLGLSLCRSIVAERGGQIEVESEVGKGATFRVVLPRQSSARIIKASVPPALSTRRKRVLVVDDEPLVCSGVQRLLGKEHDVTVSVSSRSAFAEIRRGARYDVIFCDLMMPEMSGVELYERIRGVAPELVPHIVFITGGILDERTRGFLVGVGNALLEKPLSPNGLRRAVGEETA